MQELEAFGRLALQLVPVDQVIHALIGDVLAASQNQRAEIETHPNLDHECVVDLLARIEGHVQEGQPVSRARDQLAEVLSLQVGQVGHTQLDELLFGESVDACRGDLFAEVYV